MYNNKKNILAHVELSNICNAMCPQCGRNYIDKETKELKVRPNLNTGELSLEDYKKIFDDDFYDYFKLGKVNFCGNRSDPITSKYLHEIIDYHLTRDVNTRINVATNGGLKTTDWWYNFGKMLKDKTHLISFGIDGLSDTHSIYRVNTNFEKVIENAKSFINAGGNASWQFLVYKHNEHQIEEAKLLSEKLGFKQFKYIFTPRFYRSKDGKIDYKFKNKDFTLQETTVKDVTTSIKELRKDKKKKDFKKDKKINCKAKKINEFFLDFDGNVYPCCWLGHNNAFNQYRKGWDNVMAWYDDSMNAIKYSLKNILIKSMFLDILEKSWSIQPCDTCVQFCNVGINNDKKKYTTVIENG